MEMKIGVAGGSTKTKYVKRFIVRPMIEGSCKFLFSTHNNSIEVSLTPFSVEEMTVEQMPCPRESMFGNILAHDDRSVLNIHYD